MSKLQRVPVSQAHITHIKNNGFDPFDPDKRRAVATATTQAVPSSGQQNAFEKLREAIRLLRAFMIICLLGTLHTSPVWAQDLTMSMSRDAASITVILGVLILSQYQLRAFIRLVCGRVQGSPSGDTYDTSLRENRTQPSQKLLPYLPKEPTAQIGEASEVIAPLERAPRTNSPFHWHIEGATRQGLVRSENQDAIVFEQLSQNSSILIVCDGAGGVEGGREASQVASQRLLTHLIRSQGQPPVWRLEQANADVRSHFVSSEIQGVTTAIICLFDGDWLHYATLGDGGLSIIWSSGMISHPLVPHHELGRPSNQIGGYIGKGCIVPARIGSARLEPGCLVFAMSDGASDLLPLDQLAEQSASWERIVKSGETGLASEWLEQLEAMRTDEGGFLHSDNLTLGLAYLSKREASDG